MLSCSNGGLSGCTNTSFSINLLSYNFISNTDTVLSNSHVSNLPVSNSALNNAQSVSSSSFTNCIDTIAAFYGCSDPTAANYNPLVTVDIEIAITVVTFQIVFGCQIQQKVHLL